jgi:hypothetical protein
VDWICSGSSNNCMGRMDPPGSCERLALEEPADS